MKMKIQQAEDTGFCFGVKRAIKTLEKVSRENGDVETLGAVVHNQQVLQKLAKQGITIAKGVDDIRGKSVAIGAHGVGPEIAGQLGNLKLNVVDTTCRFVHRAQKVAQRLAQRGFFVVVYGDVNHPEVKGILAWAGGKGVATQNVSDLEKIDPLPKKVGILAQTTQIPASFNDFIKQIIDVFLGKDSELHIVDTICHDIRHRQQSAEKLAKLVDLMLVVGDRTSANTNRLAELCRGHTKTYLVETATEIKPIWLNGHQHIGITGGASTAEETIHEVIRRLEAISSANY